MHKCFAIVALLLTFTASLRAADYYVYFGTHLSGPGKGFSLSHFDSDTGILTTPKYLLDAPAPAFFVIHPDGRHLFTVDSANPGGVGSYEIDPATGNLKLLSHIPSTTEGPSYISLDKTLHFILDACYNPGNVEVFAINPDFTLGQRTAFDHHTGAGPDPKRQTHAYAHSVITDPTNRFALCPDLGLDKIFIYKFDEKTGSLQPNDPPFGSVPPGAGSRHIKFHPDAKHIYVINEIGSSITLFNWDSQKGAMTAVETVSTLPPDFKGINTASEIEISADGRFVYAANRGDDSLAVFAVDPATAKLSMIQRIPSGGKTPRNFAFDPTGRWILCTNHGDNTAALFKINPTTGQLQQHGDPIPVPYPFCERFLAVPTPPSPSK